MLLVPSQQSTFGSACRRWVHDDLLRMQVRSGSEDLTVDADSNPMMRSMMQKLYHVSQAFNKAGRSKLLVPVDVALENHFADDQVMKVCHMFLTVLSMHVNAELPAQNAAKHICAAATPILLRD